MPGSSFASAHEIVREDGRCGPICPRAQSGGSEAVLAFVNGLGGTPLGELYLVYAELAQAAVDGRGIEISRSLVGSYVTSLDMAGASITLLTLDDDLNRSVGRPVSDASLAVGRVTT